MAKQSLYVATRSGGRPSRTERERAIELFQSIGQYEGSVATVVELANLCLEKGKRFFLDEMFEDKYRITRL